MRILPKLTARAMVFRSLTGKKVYMFLGGCRHGQGIEGLFLFRKKFKVDLGELEEEKESLSNFLRTILDGNVISDDHSIFVDSEKFSVQELEKLVNKFIYRRHLNNKYWVALEHGAVKIHMLERKKDRKKKEHMTPPSTIKHGW